MNVQPRTAATADVKVIEVRHGELKNFNYLIVDADSQRSVIVDPAWEFGKLCNHIDDSGAELGAVLITHAHPDHIHLADAIATQFHCPILMSNTEIAVSGYFSPRLQGIEPFPRFVGAMNIVPISTPGHTPGCLCYLIGDNLFTGDVLFAEGCGFCRDDDAAGEMFQSLQYLKRTLAPDVRVYPGHSYGKAPGQSMASLLQENIYLQFTNEVDFVSYRMRKGQTFKKMMSFH